MEADLRALLVASGAVSALVPQGSILWAKRQGLPAIALWLVGENEGVTMQGGAEGLADARIQVDCWAATPDQAHDIGKAVRAVLSGYRSEGGSIRGVFFLSRRMTSETDSAAPEGGGPSDFHRTSLDFRVWHHPAN